MEDRDPIAGTYVELHPGETVLVDMDEVAMELLEGVQAHWDAHHPHVPRPDLKGLRHWLSPETLGGGLWSTVEHIFRGVGLFRSLRPTEGAARAFEEMRAAGLRVVFCSTPVGHPGSTSANEKLDCLHAHFGAWTLENYILTPDKTLARGRVLIDDKPVVAGGFAPVWQHVYFTRPYNLHDAMEDHGVPRHGRAVARLDRWSDWRQVLRVIP